VYERSKINYNTREKKFLIKKKERENKLYLKLLFNQGQLDFIQILISLSFQFLIYLIILLKSSSKDLFNLFFSCYKYILRKRL
jgi:hypothetical protein